MQLDTVFEKVRSDAERLLVLYLQEVGSATTEQMVATFGWHRTKTISVARNLEERGILTELEASSRERFTLSAA